MPLVNSEAHVLPSLLDRLLDDESRAMGFFFVVTDLKDPLGFITTLWKADDSLSSYLREQLLLTVPAVFGICTTRQFPSRTMQEKFVHGLNRLITENHALYEPDRFSTIPLKEHTRKLINEKLEGRALRQLNRQLVEEAYPLYFQPPHNQEPPYTLEQLKQSVSRDVEALLNTRRESLDELAPPYKELPRSLVCYGLPDFTTMSFLNPRDQQHVQRMMQHTIQTFEPRLQAVQVTFHAPKPNDQLLSFHIEAILHVEPVAERMTFDGCLQLTTAEYAIQGYH